MFMPCRAMSFFCIRPVLSSPASAAVPLRSNRPLQAAGAGKGALPNDQIYDTYFDKVQSRWIKWADVVKPYKSPMPFEFSKVRLLSASGTCL